MSAWAHPGDPEARASIEGRRVAIEHLTAAAGWVEVEAHDLVSQAAGIHLLRSLGYVPAEEVLTIREGRAYRWDGSPMTRAEVLAALAVD